MLRWPRVRLKFVFRRAPSRTRLGAFFVGGIGSDVLSQLAHLLVPKISNLPRHAKFKFAKTLDFK
jgi:hypothetical protein